MMPLLMSEGGRLKVAIGTSASCASATSIVSESPSSAVRMMPSAPCAMQSLICSSWRLASLPPFSSTTSTPFVCSVVDDRLVAGAPRSRSTDPGTRSRPSCPRRPRALPRTCASAGSAVAHAVASEASFVIWTSLPLLNPPRRARLNVSCSGAARLVPTRPSPALPSKTVCANIVQAIYVCANNFRARDRRVADGRNGKAGMQQRQTTGRSQRERRASRASAAAPGNCAASCAPMIVAEALRLGFRHIDTAQGYDNEAAVGEGIRASALRREEVFVTTKVRPQLVSQGALQRSVEESLERLGLDCVDLLLIHWPNPAIADQRDHGGAERRQAQRADAAYRRLQFHHRHARRGDRGLSRADRHQPGRVPSLSRPDEAARGDPRPRPCDHRLLSDRARQGRRRSGHRRDRASGTARPRRR